MKKSTYVIIAAIVLLASACSTRLGTKERRTINGDWVLKTIVIDGISGSVKAKILSEADLNCFVGSSWHFVNNNSLGFYSLSNATQGCTALRRNFRWSVADPKDGSPKILQYKRLDEKNNEIDANDGGFRFKITELTSNTMVLKNDVTFEGKPATFIYNFAR